MEKGNVKALLPIGVFLVLYLGLGIVFEYVLKISMGFYSIPIVVVFLIALLVACLQNKALSFDDKLALMGKGIGDKNIVTMILIFMAAGIFVGVVGRSSAQSVAYFLLSIIPAKFAVAALFIISCFVSTAMGIRRYYHAHHTHRRGDRSQLRNFPAAVHRQHHGRGNVRRQPFVYLRHDYCRVQRSGLCNAR